MGGAGHAAFSLASYTHTSDTHKGWLMKTRGEKQQQQKVNQNVPKYAQI